MQEGSAAPTGTYIFVDTTCVYCRQGGKMQLGLDCSLRCPSCARRWEHFGEYCIAVGIALGQERSDSLSQRLKLSLRASGMEEWRLEYVPPPQALPDADEAIGEGADEP